MRITDEMLREFVVITTRDKSGRHFTEWARHWEELEEAGLIVVTRPIHQPSGLLYSEEHWSVETTELGQEYIDTHDMGEYLPE